MSKDDQNRVDGELVEDEAIDLDDERLEAVAGGVGMADAPAGRDERAGIDNNRAGFYLVC